MPYKNPTPEQLERKRALNREWMRAHRVPKPRVLLTPEERAQKQRGYNTQWRKANPEKRREQTAKWRKANPDKVRESAQRAYHKDYEKTRAYYRVKVSEWQKANPEKTAAWKKRWKAENPDKHHAAKKRYSHRRRARKAQANFLLTIAIDADHCGVCLQPLLPEAQFPDPLSTTVGHEPPISRAAAEGWLVITTRPEHFRCNTMKSARHDHELDHARLDRIRLS